VTPSELVERFRVRSYEVDPESRLRIVTLCRMLQEAAWQHANLLGKGFIDRDEGGLFWVLSRLRMRISRYPRWGDEFSITTWPVGTNGIFAIRDFRLSDASGILGSATSAWLIIDGGSGRPRRPQALVDDIITQPGEFQGEVERLAAPVNPVSGPTGAVQLHDIDQYQHVNNTAYLEWMTDAIDALVRRQLLNSGPEVICSLSMDFLKELTLGAEYRTAVSRSGFETRCDIISSSDGQTICRAHLITDDR